MKHVFWLIILLYGCGNISSSFDPSQHLLISEIKARTKIIIEDDICQKKPAVYVHENLKPHASILREYSLYLTKEDKTLSKEIYDLVKEYESRLEKGSSLFYCEQKAKTIITASDRVLEVFSKRIRR